MAKVSEQTLRDAWVGDAVLTLWARRRILAQDCVIDGAKAERMTSNQFLSGYAEPSHVEAEIGRVFEARGLEAACEWIEGILLPRFEKQEERRTRNPRRR